MYTSYIYSYVLYIYTYTTIYYTYINTPYNLSGILLSNFAHLQVANICKYIEIHIHILEL